MRKSLVAVFRLRRPLEESLFGMVDLSRHRNIRCAYLRSSRLKNIVYAIDTCHAQGSNNKYETNEAKAIVGLSIAVDRGSARLGGSY